MSIGTVLTGGLGNGTFASSPALLVTEGYSVAAVVVPVIYPAATLKLAPEQRVLKVAPEITTLRVSR